MQLNYGVVKMEIVISFPCEVSRVGKNKIFVKLRLGSGKDRQGMAPKVKGLKA